MNTLKNIVILLMLVSVPVFGTTSASATTVYVVDNGGFVFDSPDIVPDFSGLVLTASDNMVTFSVQVSPGLILPLLITAPPEPGFTLYAVVTTLPNGGGTIKIAPTTVGFSVTYDHPFDTFIQGDYMFGQTWWVSITTGGNTATNAVIADMPGGVYGFGDLVPSTSTVPVPAAVWLFGSGLLGMVGVARRKVVAN